MHPVIRITTFLLIAVLLARAHPMQMGWVLCVIGLTFIFEKGKGITAALKLLWRVRWLLLSILLIYVWMPIGTFTDSLWLASQRIALLLVMLFALQALVLNMSRDNIVQGLYVALMPLSVFGLSRQRMVLRLVLTLDSISQLPVVLGQQTNTGKMNVSPLRLIVERLINAISQVLSHCETATHETVSIKTDATVPLWQWSLPLVVMVIFFSLPVSG